MEETWWTQPEQLDDHQAAVVALDDEHDHLVLGPPGSGKTNLLVLRSAYLLASGYEDIVLLTFGRVLREFLVAGATNYELPKNRIQTYLAWGKNLLQENEIPFDGSGKFEIVRSKLLFGLQTLANLARPENINDCILLDEAQDYTPEEIGVIRKFTRRMFAAGDERQRIYRNDGAIDYLRSKISSISELPFHYRNGISICKVADGIRSLVGSEEGMEASSNYDEKKNPSTAFPRRQLSIVDQVKAAVPDIRTQLRAYPGALIGVICPRNAEVTEVWDLLRETELADDIQLHQGEEGYGAFDPDKRVVVATTHGAKGLEFRALHILGADKISNFPHRKKNIAYTAVTRAKTSLVIYSENALPSYIDQGLAAASPGPGPAPPSLKALFKSGKGKAP